MKLQITIVVVALCLLSSIHAFAATCPAGWVDITAQIHNPAYPLVCESKACSCADFKAGKCRVVFPPAKSIVCDKGSIPEQPGGGCTTGCVSITPDLKIHAEWGGSNTGSTDYGPYQTAYISVTNAGTADCTPPAGQQFVVGVYFKSIGLIKATSVGPFPTHIAPGQTFHFVAQGQNQIMFSLRYQAMIYRGLVDFYVASKAPGGLELSAATHSACAYPEISIANNNAHSVNEVITNP